MKEKRYRETEPLKKGELVVMHTCVEARNPKYEGKIWTCRTDQFTRGTGAYEQDSIFLEGFSGSFAPEYLQRVHVGPLLAVKDSSIKEAIRIWETQGMEDDPADIMERVMKVLRSSQSPSRIEA